ncbi:FHA domain-containing protein [Parashewanella curva]|uniref:FHA domain-containing protein n=1 Tax=Parashewanella curva TaxID=2338552 RepID=A0A3L8Q0T4_9GAMM|nr:FHA domain-containing protein [Parashewanella curva]RLV61246.1 FHA domain-containing protein [Parashewanella curva]
MPLSIRIISSPEGESISEWNKNFPETGGEIGRSPESTMTLNDVSRIISSQHAVIRKTARGYQVMDNSSNGLFINGSSKPLGRGVQTSLNDGDILGIGNYRLLVSCFLPEQATAHPFDSSPQTDDLDDDPFHKQLDLGQQELRSNSRTPYDEPSSHRQQPIELEPTIQESQLDLVEDDPFNSGMDINIAEVEKEAEIGFVDVEEDPFYEESLAKTKLPSPIKASVEKQETSYSLARLISAEENLKQKTENAMELAISKLLIELSPSNLQSMFDDLTVPSIFHRKPNYWEMYKRFYSRQLNSRTWQIKFHAYFTEALKTQRNGDED